MKHVLHVGCGPKRVIGSYPLFPAEQWIETRLDIDPLTRPDIVSSMTDMPMIPANSHDAVFSSHNLEHLFPHELSAALLEFRRVLRPGGFLLVIVPDIEKAAAAIAEGKADQPLYMAKDVPINPFDIIYGHRASIAQGKTYMAHRNGFVAKTLIAALDAAGFTGVHGKRKTYDLIGMGYKDHRPAGSPALYLPEHAGL